MTQYRKKPVGIEAIKFVYTNEGIALLKEFCGSALGMVAKARHPDALGEAEIGTLEDGGLHFEVKHVATEGDYIIRGIAGEFYPCKPDIFHVTYEEVKNESS